MVLLVGRPFSVQGTAFACVREICVLPEVDQAGVMCQSRHGAGTDIWTEQLFHSIPGGLCHNTAAICCGKTDAASLILQHIGGGAPKYVQS
eukprot:3434799-Amphidinium_carterae.2